VGRADWARPLDLWHPLAAEDEGNPDLQADQEPQSGTAPARPRHHGEHNPVPPYANIHQRIPTDQHKIGSRARRDLGVIRSDGGSASYSMYPVSGSTCDRKFRIASSWSAMLDGRPSDDVEENP
jgi:hypothetical protein